MQPVWLKLLEKAGSLFQQGRLAESRTIAEDILAKHPDATDARHLLALILRGQGDVVQAESLLSQCVRELPGRADVRANLGNLLASCGRYDEATRAYRSALDIEPAFRPARLGLGRALTEFGDGVAAADAVSPLLERNCDDAEALNVLGSALRIAGDSTAAENAFRRALDINPKYAVARHNLGALLAEQSRSEEALEALRAAAESGISGSEIDLNMASTYIALLQFDEAEHLLLRRIDVDPGNLAAHTLVSRLRYMQGRDDFKDTYRRALDGQPKNHALCIGYSQVLRGAGMFDDAREAIESHIADAPADAALLGELAAVHLESGAFENAVQAALKARDIDPALTALDDVLIDALTCLGRADEAAALIRRARSRQPINQWYIAMEATVARLAGRPRYAELYDFERFVRSYDLPVPQGWESLVEFNADLAAALERRHRFSAPPLDQSLRNGSQTPRGLLGDPDPVIQAFLRAIEVPLEQYRHELGNAPGHPLTERNTGPLRLVGCWSVRLHRDGYHVNHVHSEGWLSSAYYVRVPDEVADEQAKNGWLKFGEPRFPVPGARAESFIRPRPGLLALFPSYMWHGTTPIRGPETRLTIAFDAVPGGSVP